MRDKAAYDNMLAHLNHLESKSGVVGILNKPQPQIIALAKENGCEEDLKVIRKFGEHSKAYYVSPEVLGAVHFFINQGFYIDEIVEKIPDLDRADIERIMKAHPEYHKLYQKKRHLRDKRRTQQKQERRKQVGKKISMIRKALGLDFTQFAMKVGLQGTNKQHTVANWEKGMYLPTKENLEAIAHIGNTTVMELLETERTR